MKGKPSHKRQCLADRLAHSERLSGLLAEQGLSHPEAAKLLHVSLRTLQNWLSGKHQIPYMAFKLLRLLRYTELPGKTWQGWHFSRGMLVTPEGRTIAGHEGSWWSMLVRQARSFHVLYQQMHLPGVGAGNPVSLMQVPEAGAVVAGLPDDTAPASGPFPPSCNTGGKSPLSSQHDVIMTSWPTLYDFPTPLTERPEPAAKGWESASTGSYPSPLTPICEALKASPGPNLSRLPHSLSSPASELNRQTLSNSSTLPLASELPGKVLSLPLSQSRFLDPSLAKLTAPGWPTGTGAIPSPILDSRGVTP